MKSRSNPVRAEPEYVSVITHGLAQRKPLNFGLAESPVQWRNSASERLKKQQRRNAQIDKGKAARLTLYNRRINHRHMLNYQTAPIGAQHHQRQPPSSQILLVADPLIGSDHDIKTSLFGGSDKIAIENSKPTLDRQPSSHGDSSAASEVRVAGSRPAARAAACSPAPGAPRKKIQYFSYLFLADGRKFLCHFSSVQLAEIP
jgi:hypothetical protein